MDSPQFYFTCGKTQKEPLSPLLIPIVLAANISSPLSSSLIIEPNRTQFGMDRISIVPIVHESDLIIQTKRSFLLDKSCRINIRPSTVFHKNKSVKTISSIQLDLCGKFQKKEFSEGCNFQIQSSNDFILFLKKNLDGSYSPMDRLNSIIHLKENQLNCPIVHFLDAKGQYINFRVLKVSEFKRMIHQVKNKQTIWLLPPRKSWKISRKIRKLMEGYGSQLKINP